MNPTPSTPATTGLEALIKHGILDLPDVTLICVDTAFPEAALRAVRHCMQQVRFGAAVLVTRPDHRLTGVPTGLEVVANDTIHSIAGYSGFLVHGLLEHVRTSHCLVVQWDGLITNTSAWDPRFLSFDYIGAVWRHTPPGQRVGNGGFSLRSRRLLKALRDPDIIQVHPEDSCIAITYRNLLERRHGIRFADEETARRFSIEGHRSTARASPQAPPTTFGVHGLDALYRLLPADQFMWYAGQLPGRLFGGAGARRLIATAAANGDARLALYALRQRRRHRKSFWSGIDLWFLVLSAWLRSVFRRT